VGGLVDRHRRLRSVGVAALVMTAGSLGLQLQIGSPLAQLAGASVPATNVTPKSAPAHASVTPSPPAASKWEHTVRSPSTPVTVVNESHDVHPAGTTGRSAKDRALGGRSATTSGANVDQVGTSSATQVHIATVVATNGSGAAHGTWSALPPMPTARANFATWIGAGNPTGPLVTLGGVDTATGAPSAVVESVASDGGSWTWQQDAPLPVAMRMASAIEDQELGIEITGITGSPSTTESIVVYSCGNQSTACFTTTNAWRLVTSETLGHVAVAGLTAFRLCDNFYYHCPNGGVGIHLDFLGCSASSWSDVNSTPTTGSIEIVSTPITTTPALKSVVGWCAGHSASCHRFADVRARWCDLRRNRDELYSHDDSYAVHIPGVASVFVGIVFLTAGCQPAREHPFGGCCCGVEATR
jgi:hypothetical protein